MPTRAAASQPWDQREGQCRRHPNPTLRQRLRCARRRPGRAFNHAPLPSRPFGLHSHRYAATALGGASTRYQTRDCLAEHQQPRTQSSRDPDANSARQRSHVGHRQRRHGDRCLRVAPSLGSRRVHQRSLTLAPIRRLHRGCGWATGSGHPLASTILTTIRSGRWDHSEFT